MHQPEQQIVTSDYAKWQGLFLDAAEGWADFLRLKNTCCAKTVYGSHWYDIRASNHLSILFSLTTQAELCLMKVFVLSLEACPNLACEADTPGRWWF